MSCRITLVRHVHRIKTGLTPQIQNLSEAGMLTAWVMGRVIRAQLGDRFVFPNSPFYCSPQFRSSRTCLMLFNSLLGDTLDPGPAYQFDFKDLAELNDYSSDKRQQIQAGMEQARRIERDQGIEVEQAMFLTTEGTLAVEFKVREAMEVVDGMTDNGRKQGHFMFGGLHGCTIDGLYVHMFRRTGEACVMSPAQAGGIFNYGEGFSVDIGMGSNAVDGGEFPTYDFEIFRQPAYLKAALAAMGE